MIRRRVPRIGAIAGLGRERRRIERARWLRAAILGPDDGILSTASPLIGIAAAHGTRAALLTAGAAELAAGAMSMAADEYVPAHSQADSEPPDLACERIELGVDTPWSVSNRRRST